MGHVKFTMRWENFRRQASSSPKRACWRGWVLRNTQTQHSLAFRATLGQAVYFPSTNKSYISRLSHRRCSGNGCGVGLREHEVTRFELFAQETQPLYHRDWIGLMEGRGPAGPSVGADSVKFSGSWFTFYCTHSCFWIISKTVHFYFIIIYRYLFVTKMEREMARKGRKKRLSAPILARFC